MSILGTALSGGLRNARVTLLLAIVTVVAMGMGTSCALAASPWWHLATLSAPHGAQTVTVDTLTQGGGGANERQEVTVDPFVTGGRFVLSFDGEATASIPARATAAQVQTALQGLVKIGAGGLVVSGPDGGPWTVEFAGALSDTDVAQLTADASSLSGEAQVVIDAANLGDAPASSEAGPPVVLEDKLPPGVEPSRAYAEGGGSGLGYSEQYQHASCSLSGRTVTCTYPLPILPYEEAIMVIDVKVAAGVGTGVNRATVSGGVPQPITQHEQLALEGVPSYGVAHLELTPEEDGGAPAMLAGSHPFQLTSTFALNTQALPVINGLGTPKLSFEPVGLTKDLRFNVPPGLVVNATAMPKCSNYVFSQEVKKVVGFQCPADTVLGVATSMVVENRPVSPEMFAEPFYNLEPAYGEPARFGFAVPAVNTPVILDTVVDIGGGNTGATVIVRDLTQQAAVIGSQVTFWGWPPDQRHDSQRGGCVREGTAYPKTGVLPSCPLTERPPKPFLLMPTSCSGPLQTSVEADTWEAPGSLVSFAAEPIPALRACNQVPFSPIVKSEASTDKASAPSGLDVNLDFNDEGLANPTGITQSQIERTVLTLPEGMTVNPSAGVGLGGCTLADYAKETLTSPPGAGCPNDSKLGTVMIESPLISTVIHGSVFIAQPYENPFPEPEAGHPNGTLLALYIVAKNPEDGILVKLPGKVRPDLATGRLTTTVEDIPQLPFAHFNFHFREGQQAPLISPPECGIHPVLASLTPWSEPTTSVTDTSQFVITKGFDGGECPAGGIPPFSPRVISGTQSNSAGSYTPFYLRILRGDNEQELTKFTTVLPPGLTANLTGIPFCPDGAIQHAREVTGLQELQEPSCPVASEIGHTLVGAGVGTVLAWTPGKLYLAGPYHGSALSIVSVTSATVGPFDLGTVVIRFALKINPVTGQAEIDGSGSDPIPHIIDGIVVHVREIHVYVDRSQFMINPTSCTPKQIAVAITGAGRDSASNADDQTVSATSRFQAADCQSLAFEPDFKVFVSGKTSRVNGAGLHVTLTYPKTPFGSQANIHSVKVSLPKQLPSRLNTLKQACVDRVFEENPAACPVASRVGTARAITPILPVPIEGPAYFVSHGGAKFPELVLVLQGYGITIDLHGETFISEKTGITSSTFRSVPDEPVQRFELTLPQGPYSALAANTNLCALTRTVVVKHKIRVRSNGRTHTVTSKVRKTVAGSLAMPTAFTAQNGAAIHRSTVVTVTGCHRRAAGSAHRGKQHRKR